MQSPFKQQLHSQGYSDRPLRTIRYSCIDVLKGQLMANWEFAAIVCEEEMWFLVKPAEVEPLRYTISGIKTNYYEACGPIFKWHSPMNWRETLDNANRTIEELNRSPQKRNHRKLKSNDLSEPNILYESEDILTLVNMAGAEGWEITGGLERWRMMRREL